MIVASFVKTYQRCVNVTNSEVVHHQVWVALQSHVRHFQSVSVESQPLQNIR